jgi:rare lipoprotein A
MLLIGLIWITSWMVSVLSLGESSANVAPKVPPTKASTNLGKIVSTQHHLPVLAKPQGKVWQATLLPTNFLKMDFGKKESKPTSNQPRKTAIKQAVTNQQKFCSALEENPSQQVKLNTANVLTSNLIKPDLPNTDFLPNKILRSLQHLFRFSHFGEQRIASPAMPVVVVRREQENYEVWLNNLIVANLPSESEAQSVQQRITQLVKSPKLDATQLRPALVDGIPALLAGNRFLFGIQKQVTQKIERSGDLLAIEWINNLRSALQAPQLSLVEGQMRMYGVSPSQEKLSGLASWYGGYFHGRTTANGEKYNQNELTVAHKTLPFNTFLQITNRKNGNSVIVRVNDRGPFIPPRSLDLSREAARCIGSETAGIANYDAVILHPSEPQMTKQGSNLATGKLKPGRKLAIVSDF